MNNLEEINREVSLSILAILKEKDDYDENIIVDNDSPLIGGNSLIDSMDLVTLCIVLEDKALELDFEFDWTSDSALSKSKSIFRTAGSLASEFFNQMSKD